MTTRVRRHEAGDVVDVAVSIVTGDSTVQPDYGLHTEIFGKHLFVGPAVHAGIALLDGREKAFLGGEQCAPAVDIDRAAFEYDAGLLSSILYDWPDNRALAAFAMRPPIFSSAAKFEYFAQALN